MLPHKAGSEDRLSPTLPFPLVALAEAQPGALGGCWAGLSWKCDQRWPMGPQHTDPAKVGATFLLDANRSLEETGGKVATEPRRAPHNGGRHRREWRRSFVLGLQGGPVMAPGWHLVSCPPHPLPNLLLAPAFGLQQAPHITFGRLEVKCPPRTPAQVPRNLPCTLLRLDVLKK